MKLNPKNTSKYVIGTIVIIALVYGINQWLKSLKKPLPADLQEDMLDNTLILKKGSQGPEVAELQKVLIKDYKQNLGNFGINNDGIDGIFGELTEKGLLAAKGVKEIDLINLYKK